MALQQILGTGLWIPTPLNNSATTGANAGPLTGPTLKVAAFGRMFWSSRTGSKNIQKVFFRFGTTTKAGGSTIKVSLQNVSTSSNPIQPDGSVLQSATIANADANYASNIFYPGLTLGAVQSVNYGQLIAVVFEYATYGGADSTYILAYNQTGGTDQQSGISGYNGSVWGGNLAYYPSIFFQFDDGTFGSFDSSNHFLFNNSGGVTSSFNSSSSPNEYGLIWQLPFPHKIDAVQIGLLATTLGTSTFNVNIYDSTNPTTAVITITVNANQLSSTAAKSLIVNLGQEYSCLANHNYYVSIQPTVSGATGNVSLGIINFSGNTHYNDTNAGGNNFVQATRAGGSWTISTVARPTISIRVSSLDDGVQTGGGGFFIS